MSETASVTLGIDLSAALGSERLTKKWLREYLRTNPQKDFVIRNTAGPLARWHGKYINGQDCIRQDVTLEVHQDGKSIAFVDFQATTDNEWGYQAVVR